MNNPKQNSPDQAGSGFAGTLRNIQLTDIIQMCCLAGASICVRVHQDKKEGNIYVLDGEIVHAECGAMVGADAFFTIMGWPSGQFETLDPATVPEPTIKEPCQFLLMEAARRADEQSQAEAEKQEAMAEAVKGKLRVLIVDDSAIMIKILTSMLMADSGIEVVGSAKNGEEALEKMKQLAPDLITMDVNMPVMDGSTALKHIMIGSPCPVVIMSNLGPASYATILSFLNLGAVDFMSKPVKHRNIIRQQQRMVDRVHLAVNANITRFQRLRLPKLSESDFVATNDTQASDKLVIGVSGVGGYLEMVNAIAHLPSNPHASVLSLQSIPPQFTIALSEYLNARSRFQVLPITEGATLSPGKCYVASSGPQITFETSQSVWKVRTPVPNDATEPEEGSESGIDRIFTSAASLYGQRAIVFLLSGCEIGSMEGLRSIKGAGGHIVAPYLEKCILPSTIKPAADAGLITEFFDPKDVGHVMRRYCR